MSNFTDIKELVVKLINMLDQPGDKTKVCLIYAFNGTGKTRIAKILSDDLGEQVMSYDAFFEDLFSWDNESYVFRFDPYSKIIAFIKDQGLEREITDNFQRLVGSKIEPSFDFSKNEVLFNYTPGDSRNDSNIKISRGEESLFIWSLYFTVLDQVISILDEAKQNRETDEFNELKYIVIDDPVSSIDETRVITLTTDLIDVIRKPQNHELAFLITTHHPLFFNILFNNLTKKNDYKTRSFILIKTNTGLQLDKQSDSPFGYHLLVKNAIQEAITTNSINKHHFNLFRGLLEKTATYLGYSNWYDCLAMEKKKEITKLLNHYSHAKLSDLESKYLPEEHKNLFISVFNEFVYEYKWKV